MSEKNELKLKRESISIKMDELEQRYARQEKLLNEFAQINVEVIDRAVKLKEGHDQLIEKYIKVEVFAMKGLIDGIILKNRVDYLESVLMGQGILTQGNLERNKVQDEAQTALMEERFLKEGV
jgi:uncharacterized coiled-coil protein SlyX